MREKLFFIFAIILATAEAGFYRHEPSYRGLGAFSRNAHGAGRRRVVWRKAPVAESAKPEEPSDIDVASLEESEDGEPVLVVILEETEGYIQVLKIPLGEVIAEAEAETADKKKEDEKRGTGPRRVVVQRIKPATPDESIKNYDRRRIRKPDRKMYVQRRTDPAGKKEESKEEDKAEEGEGEPELLPPLPPPLIILLIQSPNEDLKAFKVPDEEEEPGIFLLLPTEEELPKKGARFIPGPRYATKTKYRYAHPDDNVMAYLNWLKSPFVASRS